MPAPGDEVTTLFGHYDELISEPDMKNILSKLKNEKGQSTVEFAMVAVFVLIPVLFGITEFGRAWYRADLLKNAANIGARTCAVKKDIGEARTAAEEAIPHYDPAQTTIEILNCTATATVSRATVTVKEMFNPVVPLFDKFLNKQIERTATYRLEP